MRRRSLRHFVSMMFAVIALLCATFATTGVASAQSWKPVAPDSKQPTQTEIDEAKRRYQKGIQLYEVEGDVTTSLLELQRAYDLAPNYAVLYNIGQVARTGRDYLISLRAFEAYLQFGGAQVPPDKRTTAENEIKALKELVGTIKVTTNVTTGTVFVDDIEIGKLPSDSIRVNPGTHRVRIDSDGKQSTKTVTIAGGETQTVDVQIDLSVKLPPPELPPPPPKPVVEPKTSYAWVGWLVTGVLAAGAIGTGSVALVQNNDVNETPYSGATVPEDLDDKRSTVTALAVTTDVLIGAAVLCAGVSLYFTIRDSKSDEAPEAATSTALRVSPNGLAVIGSF